MAAADHINNALAQWFCGVEATFGAGFAADPTSEDAFAHESADLGDYQAPRVIGVGDKTGYRTRRPPIQGPHDPVALKFGMFARPAKSAATAPDYGALLQAGGFAHAAGVYTRSLSPAVSAALWGVTADLKAGHGIAGLVVSEILLSAGEDLARFDFTCEAAKQSTIYETTLAAIALAGASSITLPTTCGWNVPTSGAPCYIKIGAYATVHKVTAYAPATGIATISPVVPAGDYADASAVKPYNPGALYATDADPMAPIAEQSHSLDLANGAEEVFVTKFRTTIKTGIALRAKEAHSDFRRGVVASRPPDACRVVADLIFTLDKAAVQGYVRDLTAKDLQITIGPAGGRRIQIDGNRAVVEKLPSVEGADGPREGTLEVGLYGTAADAGSDVVISFL